MSEQLRMIPGLDPDDLIAEAKARWQPIKTYCMFSGGNDSMAVAHRCRDDYDALFFIDTGTGVDEGESGPSIVRHVQQAAAWLGKPLVMIPAGDAYRRMILGGTIRSRGKHEGTPEPGLGFPGPGMHGRAYIRLKERQIEELVRRTKRGQHRNAAVLLVSGVRRDESPRRAKRMPLTEHGSAKYVNPLIDWTSHDLARYRSEHSLPESDIAALLHRSGECNCGAFAKADEERPMLRSLFPQTFARIEALEREAEAAGIRWSRWGGYDLDGIRTNEKSAEDTGPACTDCPTQYAMEMVGMTNRADTSRGQADA